MQQGVDGTDGLEGLGKQLGADDKRHHRAEHLAHAVEEARQAGEGGTHRARAQQLAQHADEHRQQHGHFHAHLDVAHQQLGEGHHQHEGDDGQQGIPGRRLDLVRSLLVQLGVLAAMQGRIPAIFAIAVTLPEEVQHHGHQQHGGHQPDLVVDEVTGGIHARLTGREDGVGLGRANLERLGGGDDAAGGSRADAEVAHHGVHGDHQKQAKAGRRGDEQGDEHRHQVADGQHQVAGLNARHRFDRHPHQRLGGADVGHVGGKAGHRHDGETQPGRAVGEDPLEHLEQVEQGETCALVGRQYGV